MYSSVRGPHPPPDQSPGPRQHLCTCIRWDNSMLKVTHVLKCFAGSGPETHDLRPRDRPMVS